MSQSSYDQTPYMMVSFADTHPRRLCALARLFGLPATTPDSSRVLELGCAVGGNIVPMAYSLPGASLVGVDISHGQIETAREFAGAVGAENVELRAASITDVTGDWGEFDYILSHGVFSWVPREVQDATLRICGRQLSPGGVALVSFNVLPGWHSRTSIREMMAIHTESISDPIERARAGRDFIVALCESPFAGPDKLAMLQAEVRYLRDKSASYIVHEYFETNNEPMYFRDFARRLTEHGLQYLGDSRRNVDVVDAWPTSRAWMAATPDDLAKSEQYADIITGRTFRHALVCRADAKLDRASAHQRVGQMFVEALLKQWSAGAGMTRFESPRGARFLTGSGAVRNALAAMSSRFPETAPASEFVAGPDREEVARALVECWRSGVIRLYSDPPTFATRPGEAPVASAVVRHLAGAGESVINLRHETTTLSPEQRALVPLLDGTQNRDQLPLAASMSRDVVDRILAQLAVSAALER
ncbi:MAG: methyltransferase regulatory domain-containing protein [Tepidisphaeraceae bacterium]